MMRKRALAAAFASAALITSTFSLVHASEGLSTQSEQVTQTSSGPSNFESWGSHKTTGYGPRTHTDSQGRADGHFFPLNNLSNLGTKANSGAVLTNQGGPVVSAPTIYRIFYGHWASDACTSAGTSTPGVINNFLSTLGSSQWYKANTTYYQINSNGSYTFIQPNLTLGSCAIDPGSVGSTIDSAPNNYVSQIVLNNLSKLGTNPNGIYLVLTNADIVQTGFKTVFCGYHSSVASAGTQILFASIGDSGNNAGCVRLTTASPNSNPTADGMASVIAHEIVETASNPLGTTWWDNKRTGYENGDACAWVFGSAYVGTNSASSNTHAGSADYYLQENIPAPLTSTTVATGCVSALPTTSPTIASVSSYSVSPGMTMTITGTNFSTASNSTVVGFGGIYAAATASTPTSLTVIVPSGAKSGPLHLVTSAGVALRNSPVTVIPAIAQPTLLISNTANSNLPANNPVSLTTTGGSGSGIISFTATGTGCSVISTNLGVTSAPTTCSVTAHSSATAGFLAATSASKSFSFVGVPQSPQISLSPTAQIILNRITGIRLSTTGGQGSGASTFSTTNSGNCGLSSTTASSPTLTIVPTTGTGSCTVTVTKAASGIYLASTNSVIYTY